MKKDPVSIPIRLSKEQAAIIWPGLNHMILANLTCQRMGESLTSFPFWIGPFPRGFDSGTFSEFMMKSVERLWTKLKPKAAKGGRLRLDTFELRIAAFAARVTVQMQCDEIRRSKKTDKEAKRSVKTRSATLKKRANAVRRSLGRYIKRANRAFQKQESRNELSARSREWRSHLRWMQFHLAYFNPVRAITSGRIVRKLQRSRVNDLMEMVKTAGRKEGVNFPDLERVRHVIRLFIRYDRRGRLGSHGVRYMLNNREKLFPQLELLEFVQNRLQ